MTKIYVNGNHVAKEKLSKIEIQSEEIKRILSEKLTKTKKQCTIAV